MASKRLSLLVCNVVNDRGYKMGKPSSSSGKKNYLIWGDGNRKGLKIGLGVPVITLGWEKV